jgi:predicted Zn-dependent peptidase
VVAVSGDFDRADMTARLETLFAAWPFPGESSPAVPTGPSMAAPGIYLSQKKVNQSRVSFLLPGVLRDDPDMPAIDIMNDIFGGGGFTSRITNRVRSDEGLAYSVGSRFTGGIYFRNPFLAVLQTKSRTVAYAASLVQQEMKRIASEPVTDAELQTSKRSAIETFPETFASADKSAAVLADDELTGRYATRPDYWKTFRARIESVTAADVQRVAAKYLHPDKVVLLIVGDAEEIALGSPDHPLQLTDLGLGTVQTLPQRDPLTLQPVPAAK